MTRASQRSAGPLGGARGLAPSFRSPRIKRGEMERPKTLVRERAHPWPASRSSPSPENSVRRGPAHDGGRRAFRRSIAAFSLRRRAALCVAGPVDLPSPAPVLPFGPERPPHLTGPNRPPSAKLLAGGHSASGRSPAAARVRAVRQHARGRRTSRCGFPLWPPKLERRISSAAPVRPATRRLMKRPLGGRGS